MRKRLFITGVVAALLIGVASTATAAIVLTDALASNNEQYVYTKYTTEESYIPESKFIFVAETSKKAMSCVTGSNGLTAVDVEITNDQIKVDSTDPDSIVWSTLAFSTMQFDKISGKDGKYLKYDNTLTGMLTTSKPPSTNSYVWEKENGLWVNEQAKLDGVEGSILYSSADNAFSYSTTGETLSVYKIQEFTVTFNMNGHGTQVEPQTLPIGSVIKNKKPSETGYVFLGWYKEAEFKNKWDFTNDTIKADMTLHARWADFSFTTHSVGGYYKNGDTKVPLVGFGFEIISSSLSSILDSMADNTFGIIIYSNAGSTKLKEFKTATVKSLIENEGRFYCSYIDGNDNTTYYAKAYFTIDKTKYNSDIINATTSTSGTEYTLK